MSRPSSSTFQWVVLGLLVAMVAAFISLAPSSADAQATNEAQAEIVVADAVDDFAYRTAALAFTAGDTGLAALSGSLTYDADAITVVSCEISEAGACNAREPGVVRVSVFKLNRLVDNDQLMTVNFYVNDGATGSTTLEFEFTEVLDSTSLSVLTPLIVEPYEFELTPPAFGSLTGDVVAADSLTGLFAIDVCAVNVATQTETCTTTGGLGTWRIDDIAVGSYRVEISDPAEVYGTASITTTVAADEITTGLEAALGYASDQVEEEDTDETNSADDTPVPPAPPSNPRIQVIYEAQISGTISDKSTAEPIQGLVVCATQPLVLHQSCDVTGANGEYALDELSAGNYWVTVIDSLGLYQDSPTKLIGVVDDTTQRQRVNIQVDRNAG